MEVEDRANVLRDMKICRFCLSEDNTLTSIYNFTKKDGKPLALQLMACLALEVFPNDGMPQTICKRCISLTKQAYTFKANSKKADEALKSFLTTGNLVKPFRKSDFEAYIPEQQTPKRPQPRNTNPNVKKIKLENEIITINVEGDTSKSNEICSEDNDTRDSETNELEQVNFSIIKETEGDEETEEEEEEEEEEDDGDNLHPTKKVNQVKTSIFACEQCDRTFPLKQLYDIHQANHDRERLHECDLCDRKFFTKYDLAKHHQVHDGLKPFTCSVCDKSFARENLLHRHEKSHVDVAKYLCGQCDRTFLNKEDLESHIGKQHKKNRPYTCTICHKSFVFKQGLERHEVCHAGAKPHKCNYCEASFTSPIKLTRHITSHAGLRPYPCKVCGRTFLLSHHLTRHMRSHFSNATTVNVVLGEYKCDSCSMSFRRKDSLINHSAIHSMVNLRCVICNTEFKSAASVKEHITSHLAGLPYPCEKCDYSFESQLQLEEHELKHAEMEYEDQIEKEVVEEARQAAGQAEEDYLSEDQEAEEEEEGSEDEDGVTSFTLTNDMDNPEVIRKSKRSPKGKLTTLKNEVLSEDELEEDEYTGHLPPVEPDEDPFVHTNVSRTYKRKGNHATVTATPKARIINTSIDYKPTTPSEKPQVTTIENLGLTTQELKALPTEKYVNMKIGDKTVRVQKLVLTREEMKAMAKEGKIRGNTVLIKNPGSLPMLTPSPKIAKQVDLIDTILNDDSDSSRVRFTRPRPEIKKTYGGSRIKMEVPQVTQVNAEMETEEEDRDESSVVLNDVAMEQHDNSNPLTEEEN